MTLRRPALLRLREELLHEQAALERRRVALRKAIVGLDGLLAEPPPQTRPLPSTPEPLPPKPPKAPKPRPTAVPHEDRPRILERVQEGEFLEPIAVQYGVSRQRLHQIVTEIDATAFEQGRRMRRALQLEQRGVEAEVRMVQTALRNGPCRVCRGPVTRDTTGGPRPRGHSTCSARCAELWVRCRLHLDEEQWARHRVSVARSLLGSDKAWADDPYRYRNAERVLDGTAGTHGRWVLPERGRVAEGLREVEELRRRVRGSGASWWC